MTVYKDFCSYVSNRTVLLLKQDSVPQKESNFQASCLASNLHPPISCFQLHNALRKTYCISATSEEDTMSLLDALSQLRSLLSVKLGRNEESLIIDELKWVTAT